MWDPSGYSDSPVHTRSDRDVVERVRGKLLGYIEDAADGVRLSGRAVSLATYYVRHRERLNRVRVLLHAVSRTEDHERVMHEAERAYLRQKEAFESAPSSSFLLRAWTDVLVEATEKVERDRSDAVRYAAVAANPSKDDHEWAEATARTAGERWREN